RAWERVPGRSPTAAYPAILSRPEKLHRPLPSRAGKSASEFRSDWPIKVIQCDGRAGHTWVPLQDRGHGKTTDRFAMTFFARADKPAGFAGQTSRVQRSCSARCGGAFWRGVLSRRLCTLPCRLVRFVQTL